MTAEPVIIAAYSPRKKRANFIDEYSAARTPNPCVMCNNWIKFGRLFDYSDSVGAEFVATGHYAKLVPGAGPESSVGLCRGLDETKDQSYVLFGIEPRLLGRLPFLRSAGPLEGELPR